MNRLFQNKLELRQAEIARDDALRRLRKQKADIEKAFDEHMKIRLSDEAPEEYPGQFADKDGKYEGDIQSVEVRINEEKRRFSIIQTRQLTDEMERLGVPRPEGDVIWFRDTLTADGIHAARHAIRQERRARREGVKDWAVLFFGGGGLVIAFMTLLLRIIETSSGN